MYKALLDILTDPETKSRRECLESQLFYKDNGGAMADADPAAGANLERKRRRSDPVL